MLCVAPVTTIWKSIFKCLPETRAARSSRTREVLGDAAGERGETEKRLDQDAEAVLMMQRAGRTQAPPRLSLRPANATLGRRAFAVVCLPPLVSAQSVGLISTGQDQRRPREPTDADALPLAANRATIEGSGEEEKSESR